jgi:Ca2+-binding EF-hand superfamily protein
MSRPILWFSLAFLLGFPAALVATAQTVDRVARLIQAADANADGDVTKAEFQAFRARQFSRLDRNRDGAISVSDVPARLQKRVRDKLETEDVIAGFDLDGDKKVSRQEFEKGPTKIFDTYDTDADGVITRAEFDHANSVQPQP